MSDSLRPHRPQHARLPCSSPSPRVCSNSCPPSQWCSFSLCLQYSPVSRSLPWVGCSHQVAKVLELQHQSFQWIFSLDFLLGLTGLVSLQSKGLSVVLLQHNNSKAAIFQCSAFFMFQLSHLYTTTGKTLALTIGVFVSKMMSLLFNMLSSFVIAFLQRSRCLLTSWLQSPPTVISESKKIKSVPAATFIPSICHEVMGPDAMIFVYWRMSFKPAFLLSSFTLIKRLFSSSSLCVIRVV